ncbi:MucR family transcriptional regulator [Methylobacterium brachythecii]|uniref:MucR family transcriptional regulator n=1 Tax=Methylobacterium brachythecii TaxID=1176177 RepID=A0A7W6F8Q6_9HYPH|nr:MucR family transcriptional regulator [Methylobacterium brachythecii]MBB3904762.1 putative transcriptional regulator [Methylobacterium brachythecii]GLS45561.1 MucR family transcriptional regulator [Methylobacterium brachythecii]
MTAQTTDAVSLAANIVAAYISNNSLPAGDLPAMLVNVHRAVAALTGSGATDSAAAAQPDEVEKPTSGQVRKSITPDAIISFIDGKAYKTMKRHLGTHGLDPHSYRQRYGLPSDYPMVAPNYAAQRSALAKSIGLGRPGNMAPIEEAAEGASQARKPRARKAA